MRIKNPEVSLTVTDDHFNRAVAGDPCHCTIGEATHDALGDLIPALNLKDVDAATISVHPADIDGEPAVSVGFIATDKEDTEVTVRFLLQDTAAFKVAYVTDNRAKSAMQRRAARKPYSLSATEFKIRKRDRDSRPDTPGNVTVTPERHIVGVAANVARRASSAEETAALLVENLTAKSKAGTLPYKLTASLKRYAAGQAASAFGNIGTKPRSAKHVKVYTRKRFYG